MNESLTLRFLESISSLFCFYSNFPALLLTSPSFLSTNLTNLSPRKLETIKKIEELPPIGQKNIPRASDKELSIAMATQSFPRFQE